MYLINSPVVRAESLKFQEAGVLGVVKEVFLPLYNAFRFFVQNMERWEANSGNSFVPSTDKVRATANPTDVWISAATQGLIKFVHEEMTAYRLYTVMPALVSFVTQLTNWYVRLNRDRLKGLEGGETESETGLQVLYNVLLDVTMLMAPFTPFITEYWPLLNGAGVGVSGTTMTLKFNEVVLLGGLWAATAGDDWNGVGGRVATAGGRSAAAPGSGSGFLVAWAWS